MGDDGLTHRIGRPRLPVGELSEAGLRKRAQREIPLEPCEVCGDKADRHHINGDISDNRPENIAFLCRHHHTREHVGKLTDQEAREIKEASPSRGHEEIARAYGVSGVLVAFIRSGRKWKCLG